MSGTGIVRWTGFTAGEILALVNQDSLAQHVDDSAFLWHLRQLAVDAPQYALADIVRLDGRVDAHIDGLRVAGDAAWPVIARSFSFEQGYEIFPKMVLAVEAQATSHLDEIHDCLCTKPELLRGVAGALAWVQTGSEAEIDSLSRAENPVMREAAFAACAILRREHPGIRLGLSSSHAGLRASAIQAAGQLGKVEWLPEIEHAIGDGSPDCSFQGLWAAIRLGSRRLSHFSALKAIAEADGHHAREAAILACRAMSLDEAIGWHSTLARNNTCTRLAAIGAGAIGDPRLVPALIALMEIDEFARVAGESFSTITGADLSYLDLTRPRPENFEAGSGEAADLVIREDDELPWPDARLVGQWWQKHRGSFIAGERYLAGNPLTTGHLLQVIAQGKQRQRSSAALELALSAPGEPMFEVRAPARVQLERLRAWNS